MLSDIMSCKDRHEVLLDQGWERRTITEEPRLLELVETYESLDIDVHLEPVTTQLLAALGEDCNLCYRNHLERFKVIYTRNRSHDKHDNDQLR